MKSFISILICTILVSSCDPGYAVILNNRSAEIKQVKVIKSSKHKYFRIPEKDSLQAMDFPISNPYSQTIKEMIFISKDTINNCFTLLLGNNKSVILEKGVGFADPNQKIVINKIDTIKLKDDKRAIFKKKRRSTIINIYLD